MHPAVLDVVLVKCTSQGKSQANLCLRRLSSGEKALCRAEYTIRGTFCVPCHTLTAPSPSSAIAVIHKVQFNFQPQAGFWFSFFRCSDEHAWIAG